jgi:hypothetical protein
MGGGDPDRRGALCADVASRDYPRSLPHPASHERRNMSDTTALEAAAFRRLIAHLRERSDVQNIDLMILAGFCRNCLANWVQEAADAAGTPMDKGTARELVYGEPFEQWKARHQQDATPEQLAAFAAAQAKHPQ